MTCKGRCSKYKATKPSGTGRYSSGQRRCQVCEQFINWEGLWCPCCGYRLRTRPRNRKYKNKLLKSKTDNVPPSDESTPKTMEIIDGKVCLTWTDINGQVMKQVLE